MWPRRLPHEVRNNELRSAECKVFDRLETQLDNSFVVFYSRPWLGLRPDGSEVDGECDFLVAHPELGILALEVKGGAVGYDPGTDQWMSRDRWGFRHRIKNPVEQARKAKHELLGRLKDSPDWRPRFVRARHAVIFPDSTRPAHDLGPDRPLRIFCFLDDFDDLGRWIRLRFGDADEQSRAEEPLGGDGLRALEKLLAEPFQLSVPLGHYLADDDRELSLLTTQQFHILAALEAVPRAAVAGGAGTGKTVLAMEKALRSARKGLRTLFICFNRPLAEYVRRHLSGVSNVDVGTFHWLCERLINDAGIRIPTEVEQNKLFREIYPELALQALQQQPDRRVDCIVVDEAQDFEPHWWVVLDSMLLSEGRRGLYVFYDSNQRVYGETLNLPDEVGLVPIRLRFNLRNTRRIYEVVRPHYRGFPLEAIGPEGTSVEWIEVEDYRAQRARISAVVQQLTSSGRVHPEDIAVLVGRNAEIHEISPSSRICGHPVIGCELEAEDSIVVDTVRRFKGLERSVIVLLVTADLIDDAELLYVALSRPRTHLIIVGPAAALSRLRELAAQRVEGESGDAL